MQFKGCYIPYRAYWSSPFCRWQGRLAEEHPIKLAAACARRMLDTRGCDPAALGSLHLGMSVPQHQSFYGAPWLGALMDAPRLTGPTIAQACATSARVIASAGSAVSLKASGLELALATDRISNGPHIYYPKPSGPGGQGVSENWVMDNFNKDPYAGVAMVQTAENVAARAGISRTAQDELAVHRYQQYQESLAGDRAFQRGYMQAIELRSRAGVQVVDTDEGVNETS
ncbi:MAG: thiolase family protein, partial [Burkholderiaceae bacterium]